ncbi:uncharacterized protein LOC126894749 [Daktulosphaira vitifoliae]|uniref:uncharacterized protein LOC126894749 n=1 Tax=Daktulosphaira vitifoliae TaxID=58002 RepID=UPI0021AA300E|nr:uncharacterized protein LOC126894749 [Daktulosphaira vitifoliae]
METVCKDGKRDDSVECRGRHVWNRFASCVKNISKEIVGDSRSRMPGNIENWDEDVPEIIESKKKQFKVWQKSKRRKGDWMEYKRLCKETKCAVSKAKFKRYDELYDRLGTKEVDKEIY